uniref:Uncharacterized protein n=1 Tax=Arundo donax TaxID=35708 RepID=A0A0A9HHT9_ARUDO
MQPGGMTFELCMQRCSNLELSRALLHTILCWILTSRRERGMMPSCCCGIWKRRGLVASRMIPRTMWRLVGWPG